MFELFEVFTELTRSSCWDKGSRMSSHWNGCIILLIWPQLHHYRQIGSFTGSEFPIHHLLHADVFNVFMMILVRAYCWERRIFASCFVLFLFISHKTHSEVSTERFSFFEHKSMFCFELLHNLSRCLNGKVIFCNVAVTTRLWEK